MAGQVAPVGPTPPGEDPRLAVEDAIFDGLDRTWLSELLLLVLASVHLATSAVMVSRGSTGWLWALARTRGPRLLTRAGAMDAELVGQGEAWRLVSMVFLHGGGLHLLVNGVALYGLGRLCEAIFGRTRMLWIFLLSGASGATVSWVADVERSVGASGGIFGLMGALVIFGWRYRDDLPGPTSAFFRIKLLPWVVLNLVVGVYVAFIDHWGHFGGLLAGSVLAMVLGNRVVPGEDGAWPSRVAMGLACAGCVLVAALGVASKW